jgi:5'-nucleotidase
MKVIISNPKNLEKIKSQIKKDGFDKLHILSDFDRTLTYGVIKGIRTPSLVSMLRDGNHLTKYYAKKANALFDKYHPIEIDPAIPLPQKRKAMKEWWDIHNDLLIKSGLSKRDLEDIVKNGHVKFREGVPKFLDFLYRHNVPLVILSASECGDALQMFFQNIGRDYPNIFYITNYFHWNKNDRAISAKGSIIHCLNKEETILKGIPKIYSVIKNRRNVILLGDSKGDLGMIEGFGYKNLLKIGFLNFDYNKSRREFERNFDVVLQGDGNFNYINDLIRRITRKI